MAPTCKKKRRAQLKKSKESFQAFSSMSKAPTSPQFNHPQVDEGKNSIDIRSDDCSTPKSSRIPARPDLLPCPPAPKKKRAALHSSKRIPAASTSFFNAPELELFFFFAFRNVPR
ncbi:hypothetical protein ACLOJK_014985 [Asimina triloba]